MYYMNLLSLCHTQRPKTSFGTVLPRGCMAILPVHMAIHTERLSVHMAIHTERLSLTCADDMLLSAGEVCGGASKAQQHRHGEGQHCTGQPGGLCILPVLHPRLGHRDCCPALQNCVLWESGAGVCAGGSWQNGGVVCCLLYNDVWWLWQHWHGHPPPLQHLIDDRSAA